MNNTYHVLPFYSSTDQQFVNTSYCAGDVCTWKLITPRERLLPFQFPRAENANHNYTIYLHDVCTGIFTDITALINASDITFDNVDDLDYFTYYGLIDLVTPLDCGIYYLQVDFPVAPSMYSELFQVMDLTDVDFTIYRATMDKDIPGTRRKTTDAGDLRIVN
jgi:hypothetical protein